MSDKPANTAEAVDSTMGDAVEAVEEVAEGVNEDVAGGKATVTEGTTTIAEAVEEEAAGAAEELNAPELADQIADGLFRRLKESGLFPPEHESAALSETAAESAPPAAETPAEPPAADTAPEAVHWWFRDLSLKRSR